ncbi:hypothetical protein B484DRAFT_444242 [Ochromonadaceae sp. CCMP2298]|nr:hypothetical protein B484DRAFT_444242 [Ochromonadaceae sp. CCMP2298]
MWVLVLALLAGGVAAFAPGVGERVGGVGAGLSTLSTLSTLTLHATREREIRSTARPSAFMKNLFQLMEAESIGSLMPKEDLMEMIREVRSNAVIMKKVENRFQYFWKYFAALVYNEKRSFKEILGPEISTKVLQVAEKLDIYDHRTVRSFIQTPAFSHVMSGLVYESVFDVVKNVDVMGRVVNRIPIVGDLRRGIGRGIKRGIDNTIGLRVRTLMTPVVNENNVGRIADFMSSQKNKKAFEMVNRNIVENVISRPLCTIFPPYGSSEFDAMRQAVWNIIVESPPEEIFPLINVFYENLSSTKLSELLTVNFDPLLASTSKNASHGGKTVFSTTLKNHTTINIIVKV